MANKYKQQSDGRYRTKVWDGTYQNGKKHYIFLTSTKSSKDLERIVADFEAKREGGTMVVSQAITVHEYAVQWRSIEKGLSESATKEMYDRVIEKHLQPLKTVQFDYFTRANVQSIINSNADKPRTCQQIVLTLKQICKSAERDKLLPFGKTIEIFDRIQIPKYQAEEKKPLTTEQSAIVESILKTHVLAPRARLFLTLIYFCGLRREEALAVKFDDIQGFSVTVNKALHLGDTSTEIKTTKSARGVRSVPLPPDAVKIIQDILTELEPNHDGFMFYTKTGGIITRSSYRKMWESIEATLGFDCSAHIFRHTYCTKLCYEAFEHRTISVKQIAKLLGDTDKMITDVYSHLVEEREQTNDAIISIFGGQSRQHSGNQLATNS